MRLEEVTLTREEIITLPQETRESQIIDSKNNDFNQIYRCEISDFLIPLAVACFIYTGILAYRAAKQPGK